MFPSDLQDWLEGHSGQDFTWFAKRLSGNDTLANRSHQAGPYIPKDLLFPTCGSISISIPIPTAGG